MRLYSIKIYKLAMKIKRRIWFPSLKNPIKMKLYILPILSY